MEDNETWKDFGERDIKEMICAYHLLLAALPLAFGRLRMEQAMPPIADQEFFWRCFMELESYVEVANNGIIDTEFDEYVERMQLKISSEPRPTSPIELELSR